MDGMPRTRQSIYSTLLGGVSVGKKKCGLRAWNDAGPRIVSCKLTGCGQQALKLFHSAKAEVQHSFLRDCDAEGVVAMGKSSVMLEVYSAACGAFVWSMDCHVSMPCHRHAVP